MENVIIVIMIIMKTKTTDLERKILKIMIIMKMNNYRKNNKKQYWK